MIRVMLYAGAAGFEISGHAGANTAGRDIVCAAVSSAAILTANTLTGVMNLAAKERQSSGRMVFKLAESGRLTAAPILKGFALHIRALQKQYPEYISVVSQRR